MLCKLAWGNVTRARRDYLIYLLTLTLGVTVFYAFNTISLQAGTNLAAPTLQLGSDQKASGNTSATVVTNLLTGTGVSNSGATTVSNNQASTSARAE